jgi:hypothetical protein
MTRKSLVSRSLALAPASAIGSGREYARLQHETLEDRKLLAAYINEVYVDPPGGAGDSNFEYIELRGTPSGSLDDHFLIIVENEGPDLGNNPGEVEMIFDLDGLSFGTNGFLVLRPAPVPAGAREPPAPWRCKTWATKASWKTAAARICCCTTSAAPRPP